MCPLPLNMLKPTLNIKLRRYCFDTRSGANDSWGFSCPVKMCTLYFYFLACLSYTVNLNIATAFHYANILYNVSIILKVQHCQMDNGRSSNNRHVILSFWSRILKCIMFKCVHLWTFGLLRNVNDLLFYYHNGYLCRVLPNCVSGYKSQKVIFYQYILWWYMISKLKPWLP